MGMISTHVPTQVYFPSLNKLGKMASAVKIHVTLKMDELHKYLWNNTFQHVTLKYTVAS